MTERSGDRLRVESVSVAERQSIANQVPTGPLTVASDSDPLGSWLDSRLRDPTLGIVALLVTPLAIVIALRRRLWRDRMLAFPMAAAGALIAIGAAGDASWVLSPAVWVGIVVLLSVAAGLLVWAAFGERPRSSPVLGRAGVAAASFAVGFTPALVPAFLRAAGVVGLNLGL